MNTKHAVTDLLERMSNVHTPEYDRIYKRGLAYGIFICRLKVLDANSRDEGMLELYHDFREAQDYLDQLLYPKTNDND